MGIGRGFEVNYVRGARRVFWQKDRDKKGEMVKT